MNKTVLLFWMNILIGSIFEASFVVSGDVRLLGLDVCSDSELDEIEDFYNFQTTKEIFGRLSEDKKEEYRDIINVMESTEQKPDETLKYGRHPKADEEVIAKFKELLCRDNFLKNGSLYFEILKFEDHLKYLLKRDQFKADNESGRLSPPNPNLPEDERAEFETDVKIVN